MVPVVCVVGRTKAGKTTLLEGLVAELKGRGYRVATIKHVPNGFELDRPEKDSWRLAQAGSDAVLISSPQKLALIKPMDHDAAIEEILPLIGEEFDIALAEGFSKGSAPKIEVHRKGLKEGLLLPEGLLAIVSDEPLAADVPQFSWEETAQVASLIEDVIAKGPQATLLVNGSPIPLNPFAQRFIASTLGGMVSALRGVGKIRSIRVCVRKGG